jgi:hypothetical protein
MPASKREPAARQGPRRILRLLGLPPEGEHRLLALGHHSGGAARRHLIEVVAKRALNARVLQAAVDRAVQKLSVPDAERAALESELQSVESQLARLVEAIAFAEGSPSLVTAIRERETQKVALEARLKARARAGKSVEPFKVREDLKEIASEWRDTIRKRVPKGRAALQQLFRGLRLTPQPGEILIEGHGSIEPVIRAGLPENLASPTGTGCLWYSPIRNRIQLAA